MEPEKRRILWLSTLSAVFAIIVLLGWATRIESLVGRVVLFAVCVLLAFLSVNAWRQTRR